MTQLENFASLAQSGQELSRENLWPGQFRYMGSAEALACSAGYFQTGEMLLVAGGFESGAVIEIRFLQSLHPAMPELGASAQWRRSTTDDWSAALPIMAVTRENYTWMIRLGPPPQ